MPWVSDAESGSTKPSEPAMSAKVSSPGLFSQLTLVGAAAATSLSAVHDDRRGVGRAEHVLGGVRDVASRRRVIRGVLVGEQFDDLRDDVVVDQARRDDLEVVEVERSATRETAGAVVGARHEDEAVGVRRGDAHGHGRPVGGSGDVGRVGIEHLGLGAGRRVQQVAEDVVGVPAGKRTPVEAELLARGGIERCRVGRRAVDDAHRRVIHISLRSSRA